jgi:hypothetical protein
MPLRFYPGPTEQAFVGCTQFKIEMSEFNCRGPESYLAFAPWQIAITGMANTEMENAMTKKAGKLTTLAAATMLGTMFTGSAMAADVTANVGVNAAGASAATSAAVTLPGTGGVTGIVNGLLGSVTGLLGGLGLGGIL